VSSHVCLRFSIGRAKKDSGYIDADLAIHLLAQTLLTIEMDNAAMMDTYSPADCLMRRVHSLTGEPNRPISISDIQALPVEQALVSEIRDCLKSNDAPVLSTAFYFLDSLLQKNSAKAFGEEFFEFLVKRVRELLSHHSSFVGSKALALFVWLRSNYPDYRKVMLTYLASPDLGLRKVALSNFDTFSAPSELSPLIRFCNDNCAVEYSMSGPMRYDLRDLALHEIESITGLQFRTAELTEPFDGGLVTWYDWRPFQTWWLANQFRFK
jgi:hypothetical protein